MKGEIWCNVESDAISEAIGLLNSVDDKAQQGTEVTEADGGHYWSHLDLSWERPHTPISRPKSSVMISCIFQSSTLGCMDQVLALREAQPCSEGFGGSLTVLGGTCRGLTACLKE